MAVWIWDAPLRHFAPPTTSSKQILRSQGDCDKVRNIRELVENLKLGVRDAPGHPDNSAIIELLQTNCEV